MPLRSKFTTFALPTRLRTRLRILPIALACFAVSAHADERAELDQLRATTLALIQALVEQGLISQDRANALVRQAGTRGPAVAAAAPAGAASAPATVRVPYIPETMKAQIKEDIKLEVLTTARQEGWADGRKLPPWLKTFDFEADFRLREETALLDASNTPASLYRSQVESPAWSPDLSNTQNNRSRLTLRARFGFTASVSDDFSGGLRLSTGASPTSGSQTLGSSPGFFNRYTIALDRAWVRWEPWQDISATGGRMAVPFYGTDLLWPDDLSLDGVSLRAGHNVGNGMFAYATLGAFSLQELELTSKDKWLLGVQLGLDWAIGDKTKLRLGAAVYDFRNVEGVRETSPPPTGPLAGTVPYYSSEYRSGARLRGNTLINLNDPTNTGAPVWGLASKFRPVNLTAGVTLSHLDPLQIGFTLDYVKNSAFDLADIQQRSGSSALADLANKTSGVQARFQLGSRSPNEKGGWSAFLALRKFERDAWVDALTDTTWNLGGTNYKGYSLGGSYAFERHSTIGLRWTSTRNLDDGYRFLSNPNDPTSITGNLSSAPLKVDVIQLEVNSKF